MNKIGEREKQGHNFCFLNKNKEEFDWTDKVPVDDPTLQGLLEEDGEQEAIYPDMMAELPGVPLEDDFENGPAVVPDDEPDFWAMAARALKNAGIDQDACLQAAQNAPVAQVVPAEGPALINADKDKVIYELTFHLPDAGLQQPAILPGDTAVIEPDIPPPPGDKAGEYRYPLQSCRSVVGHQPYNQYAPLMTFLQLGEVRAHRSVVKANRLARMTREELLMATTTHNMLASDMIDDTTHTSNLKLITDSKGEI